MKKKILMYSFLYIFLSIFLYVIEILCDTRWCRVRDDSIFGLAYISFLPLIPIFVLSLLTYRMHDRVFLAWWSFAKWWAPLIMISTLFMNTIGTGSGNSLGSGMVDGFVYFILYGVLITVSLVRIVRARR